MQRYDLHWRWCQVPEPLRRSLDDQLPDQPRLARFLAHWSADAALADRPGVLAGLKRDRSLSMAVEWILQAETSLLRRVQLLRNSGVHLSKEFFCRSAGKLLYVC